MPKLHVKLSSRDSATTEDLLLFISRHGDQWPGLTFSLNDRRREADFWFIFDEPHHWDLETIVPPSRVFLLLGETCVDEAHYLRPGPRRDYLSQFAAVYSPLPLDMPTERYTIPFLPWMINSNHGTPAGPRFGRDFDWLSRLKVPEKDQLISVFCSTKSNWPGHALRLRFVERLKEELGSQLHWYGNGINSVPDKWSGLLPYRYSIALENQSARNVVTEKIFDPILAYSLPIYWGAPNISDLLPAQAVLPIDIRDLHGSVRRVREILDEDPWQSVLPVIIEARRKTLDEFNPIARIARISTLDYRDRGALDRSDVRVRVPSHGRIEGITYRLASKVVRLGSQYLSGK